MSKIFAKAAKVKQKRSLSDSCPVLNEEIEENKIHLRSNRPEIVYSSSSSSIPDTIQEQPKPSPKPPLLTPKYQQTPPTTPGTATPEIFPEVQQLDFVVGPEEEVDQNIIPQNLIENLNLFENLNPVEVPVQPLDQNNQNNQLQEEQNLEHESDEEMSDDRNLHPGTFNGRPDENAGEWLRHFENYCAFKEFNDAKKLALIKVLLNQHAGVWVETLNFDQLPTFAAFKTVFEQRFKSPEMIKYKSAREIFTKRQGDNETVDTFIESMRKLAKEIGADENMTIFAILAGLKSNISNYVTQKKPTTIADVVTHARVAELTTTDQNSAQLEELKNEIKQLSSKLLAAPVANRSPSPTRSKRVTFAPEQNVQDYAQGEVQNYVQSYTYRPMSPRFGNRPTSFNYQRASSGQNRGQAYYRDGIRGNYLSGYPSARNFNPRGPMQRGTRFGQAPAMMRGGGAMNRNQQSSCFKCGREAHENMLMCPAVNKQCNLCLKRGHFAIRCHSAMRGRGVNFASRSD